MEGLNQIMAAMVNITYDPDIAVNGVDYFITKFNNFIKMMNVNANEVQLFLLSNCLSGRALVELESYIGNINPKATLADCQKHLKLKFQLSTNQIFQQFDLVECDDDREEMLRKINAIVSDLEVKNRSDFPIILAYYLMEQNTAVKLMALEEYEKIVRENKVVNVVEIGRKLNAHLEKKKKLSGNPGSSFDDPVVINRIEKNKRRNIRCYNCNRHGVT